MEELEEFNEDELENVNYMEVYQETTKFLSNNLTYIQ